MPQSYFRITLSALFIVFLSAVTTVSAAESQYHELAESMDSTLTAGLGIFALLIIVLAAGMVISALKLLNK